jgi:hypothetical protein
MTRVVYGAVVTMVAAQALLVGQTPDVGKILADVRAALGGESRLAALKTLAIEGRTSRVAPDGSSRTSPFDMAFELPGKYAKKDVLGNLNGAEITRTAGFNGDGLVEQMEMPQMGGGGMVFTRAPGGGSAMQIGGRGSDQSPEQLAEIRRATLLNNKRDFTRLTLGMFATSFPVYPVEFAYAGTAESPDGKAYVLDVKGTDDFAVKLFIDTSTHLPLMLSWMDKEPLRMTTGMRTAGPGGRAASSGGGVQTMTFGGPGGAGRGMSPEEMAKMREEMDRQLKEAEANRKVVEYRMFYGDYKAFDGIKLPTKIQRMIDGNPVEELEFERVRVNGRVDQKKFEVVK